MDSIEEFERYLKTEFPNLIGDSNRAEEDYLLFNQPQVVKNRCLYFYFADLRENRIVCDPNHSFEKYLGYRKNFFKKNGLTQFLNLLSPEHLKLMMSHFERLQVCIKNLSETNCELNLLITHQIRTADNHLQWVNTHIEKCIFNDNQLVGFFGFCIPQANFIEKANFSVHLMDDGGDVYIITEKQDLKIELSRREEEVVKLIKDGFREKEIADMLSISSFTVRNHKQRIFKRLGVTSSIEALKLLESYPLES